MQGPALALSDAESLCAFARFCDPHGQVWNQVERTDQSEVRALFIRQVNNCPSGRLVAWDNATGKPVEHHLPVSIGVIGTRPSSASPDQARPWCTSKRYAGSRRRAAERSCSYPRSPSRRKR